MMKGEREELLRLVRVRDKALKSAAKQSSAEIIADFENQMAWSTASTMTPFGRKHIAWLK